MNRPAVGVCVTTSLLLLTVPSAWCAAAVASAGLAAPLETARAALRTRQYPAAQQRLQTLAAAGNAEAQYLLGQMLLNGVGAPSDSKAAREWLEKAAQQQHALAAYVLAALLERLDPPDHLAARQWLQKSADLGYARAVDALRDNRPLLAPEHATGADAPLMGALGLYAARNNDVALLEQLGRPATLATDAFGRSGLATACATGAAAAAEWLIRNGADVRAADRFGITPLMLVSEAGEGAAASAITELLLKHGADVAAVDHEKRSALFYAARRNRSALIVRLAAAHVALEATDSRGYTALDTALTADAAGAAAELRRLGVHQTQTIAAHTAHGKFDAAHPGQIYRDWPAVALAVARDDVDAVKEQLAGGTPVGTRTPQGDTLLHVALHAQSTTVLALLLAHGADAAAADRRGRSVMGLSVARKTPELLQLLLKAGVGAEAHAPQEDSPLLLASRHGNVTAASALLAARARVNGADASGQTPLLQAASAGNGEMVELLLANGADVRQRNRRGQSALWLAARAGSVDVAQRLINAHTDIDLPDELGRTPLMVAAATGDAKLAALLLRSNAHSEVATPEGDTALLLAAAAGRTEVVPLLLRGLQSTDKQNHHGDTALIAASRIGNTEVCRLLLDAGASAALRNKSRTTAADVARERGFIGLAQEIEKRG